MTVYAAGVVLWRPHTQGIQVALVRREKYNDWAFAKGKRDPGEFLAETAVRETREETGLKIKLGRKLDVMSYPLASGELKEVHYWASKVTDKALSKSKFEPNEEIAQVVWLPSGEALKQLSYEHDRELLNRVLKLHARRELETRAIILLRHAKATPRSDWKLGEATRPLLPEGDKQALWLAGVLNAFGPKRVFTSPWKRCLDTVAPYAKDRNKTIIERTQLTEFGSIKGPRQTKNFIDDVLKGTRSSVICSHRPALPVILEAIASRAAGLSKEDILSHSSLKPGEFIVIRITLEKKPRVVAIEFENQLQLPNSVLPVGA